MHPYFYWKLPAYCLFYRRAEQVSIPFQLGMRVPSLFTWISDPSCYNRTEGRGVSSWPPLISPLPCILFDIYFICCVLSHSVMSDSLQTFGLQPTRLLCPWDFPGKSTGAGCHFLLQGIFLTQWSTPCLLCLRSCREILYLLGNRGSPMWLHGCWYNFFSGCVHSIVFNRWTFYFRLLFKSCFEGEV